MKTEPYSLEQATKTDGEGELAVRELTDKHSIRHSKEARADFEQISQSGVVPERNQMHDIILKEFTERYDTPSVQEITGAIGVLCVAKAKGQTEVSAAAKKTARKSNEEQWPEVFDALRVEFDKRERTERTAKPMKKWMEAEGEIAPGGQWPEDDDERGPSCKQVESMLVRWRSAAASGAAAAAATPGDGQPLDDPDGDL